MKKDQAPAATISITAKQHKTRTKAEKLLAELTPKQYEVFLELLGGKKASDIGSKLKSSQFTVINHQREIYRKLGVKTRSELMTMFIVPPAAQAA